MLPGGKLNITPARMQDTLFVRDLECSAWQIFVFFFFFEKATPDNVVFHTKRQRLNFLQPKPCEAELIGLTSTTSSSQVHQPKTQNAGQSTTSEAS